MGVFCFVQILLFGCAGWHNPGKTGSDDRWVPPDLVLQVEQLDKKLAENSGLIFFRNKLWTINDSGGEPEIYAFNSLTGRILQIIRIDDARNRDWEDIAQDRDCIYAGDIGDNFGGRDKLTIYKISKKQIPLTGNKKVKAEKIDFSFTDKTGKFNLRQHNTHDCEAFFVCNDTIFLFTKNWQEQTTSMYCLPAHQGTYQVSATAHFNADGLVTGADISENGDFMIILGYKDYIPFIWLFYDYRYPDFFKGNRLRMDFPGYLELQTEGIAIRDAGTVYISCEGGTFPPQLYTIDLSGIINNRMK